MMNNEVFPLGDIHRSEQGYLFFRLGWIDCRGWIWTCQDI